VCEQQTAEEGGVEGHKKEEEFQRVVSDIKRRVRARVKAQCRTPQDFYPLLWAVRNEPAPLVSQTAVDCSIDRFYSQQARTCPVSSVRTSDTAEDQGGHMYSGMPLPNLLLVVWWL
jgi:hypothetical protein